MGRATLREALSRSDAPLILGTMVRRLVEDAYQRKQSQWRRYVAVDEVPDFKDVQTMNIFTDDALERILEGEPYPEATLGEETTAWRVHKYGKILKVTYEMMINDDLRAIRRLARNYGDLVETGEARLIVGLLESLPVARDINGAALTGALNEALVGAAINSYSETQDSRGNEIVAAPAFLIHAGRHRSAITTILRPSTIYDFNPVANAVVPIEEPFLKDKNSIYLISDPNNAPALEMDFLNSPLDPREDYRNGPRVIPDSIQPLTALPGDVGLAGEGFRYDTLAYKVRHVYGGAIVNNALVKRIQITP